MATGDHIRVRRWGYWHHGIDCGDQTVIHYDGKFPWKWTAVVRRSTMEQFADGGKVELVQEAPSPMASLRRAKSKLGEKKYNLSENNCEHFAQWCVSGVAESRQSRRAKRGAKVGAALATAFAVGGNFGGPVGTLVGIGLWAATGAVAGLATSDMSL